MSSASVSAVKNRFLSMEDSDLSKLLDDKDSVNTKKTTKTAVNAFKAYLNEKGLDANFEDFKAGRLNTVLTKFYAEARNSTGELYKKNSLFSLRYGINRYLKNTDIIKDVEFKKSNEMFGAVIKELKRQGKGAVNHHPPIEKGDLLKLYDYFDLGDPQKLQEKVFVDMMLHFGRRGRENIRDLKVNDFGATTDSAGLRYIYLVKDELTKNHQLDNNTAEGHMFERRDDEERCPVRSFFLYKKKLNRDCLWFFQRVKQKPTEDVWYDRAPLGHNTLGKMMNNISSKAKLSQQYSNHCLRATSVHILDEAHIPSRHIMSVTGHKSESSLKTYTGYTDKNTKRVMSHTLSAASGTTQKENLPLCKNNSKQDRDPILEEFHSDTVFDSLIANHQFNGLQTNVPLPLPVINATNVTINYNFNITNHPSMH